MYNRTNRIEGKCHNIKHKVIPCFKHIPSIIKFVINKKKKKKKREKYTYKVKGLYSISY